MKVRKTFKVNQNRNSENEQGHSVQISVDAKQKMQNPLRRKHSIYFVGKITHK